MKYFIQCLTLALAIKGTALAQGIIGFYPDGPSQFNINFVAVSDAPTDRLPFSSVTTNSIGYFNGALTNTFTIAIIVGASPNSGGQLLESGSDNSLTPISPFAVQLAPAYGYFDTLSMVITDAQLNNLLAGKWYAEVNFGTDSYLGQLTPVPEPSIIAICMIGVGVLAIKRKSII